jgi:hypothetical protein
VSASLPPGFEINQSFRTGLPKGVLATQRSFLSNVPNVSLKS